MRTVLLVSEKPSIASAIARHLAGPSASARREGRAQVWEFEHAHRGAPCRFLSTAVAGHLFSLDFTPEFNRFDIEPERLFGRGNVRAVLTDAGRGLVAPLRALAAEADELVLCLDDDREGENICFEVLEVVRGSLRRGCAVSRARFSAVTPAEVRRALAAPDAPRKALSDAVEARQEIDLKVGVAFTRFQTRHFHEKFADLDSTVISFGPCQTPTLGFCVARQDAIAGFRPRPFYGVACSLGGVPGAALPLLWRGSPGLERAPAEEVVAALRAARGMALRSEREAQRRLLRPMGMNTVQMLKAASTGLGMSPAEALAVAERLYISGYLSYPRTESTSYPPSMDLAPIVAALRAAPSPQIREHAARMASGEVQMTAPRQGTDAGDHPPITPTELVPPGLNGAELSLYCMVARHFLASLSPDAQVVRRTLLFSPVWEGPAPEPAGAAGADDPRFLFSAGFSEYRDPGWKALYRGTGTGADADAEGGGDSSEDDGPGGDAGRDSDSEGAGEGIGEGGIPSRLPRAALGPVGLVGAAGARQLGPLRQLTYREVKALVGGEEGSAGAQKGGANAGAGAPLAHPIPLATVGVYEGRTQPPEPLTEAALLSLMEKRGIGTDASMATHIENIVSRRYVALEVRGRARRLVPTSLGVSLAHGYALIDHELVSPFLRSSIEKAVTSVAEGRTGKEELVRSVLQKFRVKFLNFRDAIGQMDALFDAKFTSVKDAGRPFVVCGNCHRVTSLIAREPSRLYCKTCDEIMRLPQRAKIIEVCGKKCPCGWPLLCASYGSREKHILFCPRCYTGTSDPETVRLYQERARATGAPAGFSSVRGITCATCLRACPLSLRSRGLGRCPACAEGEENDLGAVGAEIRGHRGPGAGGGAEGGARPAAGGSAASPSAASTPAAPPAPAPSGNGSRPANAPANPPAAKPVTVRLVGAVPKPRVTITIGGKAPGGGAATGGVGASASAQAPPRGDIEDASPEPAGRPVSPPQDAAAPTKPADSGHPINIGASDGRPAEAEELLAGYLYVDCASLPEFPQVTCTRCQYVLALEKGAVEVLDTPCPSCGRRTVRYSPASPAAPGAGELRGCLLCDSAFEPYVEERESASVHQDVRRFRRGPRGGRGGRGGGRPPGRGKGRR